LAGLKQLPFSWRMVSFAAAPNKQSFRFFKSFDNFSLILLPDFGMNWVQSLGGVGYFTNPQNVKKG